MFYLCAIYFDEPLDMWRVALLPIDTVACVMSVEANNWQEARELIEECGLVRVAGYGGHFSQCVVAGNAFLL